MQGKKPDHVILYRIVHISNMEGIARRFGLKIPVYINPDNQYYY